MSEKATIRTCTIFIVLSLLLSFFTVQALADGEDELGITLPEFEGQYDMVVANMGALNSRGRTTSLVKLPADVTIVGAYAYMSGYSELTLNELGDITINFMNRTDGTSLSVAATVVGYAEIGDKNYFTYRADVTAVVAAGTKSYRLNGFVLPTLPQEQAGFFGVGLLAVYEDSNLPQSLIQVADGLDYFSANEGFIMTEAVPFDFTATGFDQSAAVKLFAAQSTTGGTQLWYGGDGQTSSGIADAIWYMTGNGGGPELDLQDAVGAIDYDNSSNSDPVVDTDPISDATGTARKWSTLEFSVPVEASDTWLSLQLESQDDKEGENPYDGVWIMAASRILLEQVGCGTIGDLVFYDRDTDGLQGSTLERGIPGVTVNLYEDNGDGVFNAATDNLVNTINTNDLGYFEFRYLDFGTYFVEIDHELLDPQYIFFTNISNPTDAIVINSCEPILDIDFGLGFSGIPGTSGAGSRRGGGGAGGGFDFGGLGFNFGGGGFFGGFGLALPIEVSNFEILDTNQKVKIAYAAIDAENATFEVYRSPQRYEGYQMVDVSLEVEASNDLEDRFAFTDNDVQVGESYYYQIVEIDNFGDRMMHGPVGVTVGGVPNEYYLYNAYPNPFNPNTQIRFSLPETNLVKLDIFNTMGQKVKTLVSEIKSAGLYVVNWDGTDDSGKNVAGGTYIYRLTCGAFEASKTITFLK